VLISPVKLGLVGNGRPERTAGRSGSRAPISRWGKWPAPPGASVGKRGCAP